MRQFLGLFLGFVTFLSFMSFTEMIDFCHAFEANGYNISYGFRRIEYNYKVFPHKHKYFIFIGTDYWELNFTESLRKVEFMSRNSETAVNWFQSNYSLALCVQTNQKEKGTTYLLHKSHEYWEYGLLTGDDNKLRISGQTKRTDVTNREVLENGTIGFVSTRSDVDDYGRENQIVLFHQRVGSYDVYGVDNTDEDKDPIHEKWRLKDNTQYEPLKDVSTEVETVAIFGHFNLNTFPGHELVIVFKVNKSLKYCWTLIDTLSENCRPENHSLLINCSKEDDRTDSTDSTFLMTTLTTHLTTTTTRTSITAEESDTLLDKPIVILLIVLVIIIFLITLFIVLIVFIKKYLKKEAPLIGLKSPKNKDMYFERLKKNTKEEEPKEVTPKKSETFETESDVDYSKPIPLESSKSSAGATESDIKRPTDLEKQKN